MPPTAPVERFWPIDAGVKLGWMGELGGAAWRVVER